MKKVALTALLASMTTLHAMDFHVDGNEYTEISDVPWRELEPGDNVYIHWRSEPYKTLWYIDKIKGTAEHPIKIVGVSAGGKQPVISGDGADGSILCEEAILEIGCMERPEHITIENLEFRSIRPSYQYKDNRGVTANYESYSPAILIRRSSHITLKNNTFHDSSNAITISESKGITKDIHIVGNKFYDNGNDESTTNHHLWIGGIGVVIEGNHFGRFNPNVKGKHIVDSAAGDVIRYNWIEGGVHPISIIHALESQSYLDLPEFRQSHVYGNMIIADDSTQEVIHYGGFYETEIDYYRKGTLHLYNNTIVSESSIPLTLLELATDEESANVFNNVINTTDLTVLKDTGNVNIQYNWLPLDWNANSVAEGTVNDLGNNISATPIGFINTGSQDWHIKNTSPLVDAGMPIPSSVGLEVEREYKKYQKTKKRKIKNSIDIGAFEYSSILFTDGFEP